MRERNQSVFLRAHWTDTEPIVPMDVVPIHETRIEAQDVRVERVVRVERTRPVVAVAACVVERTGDAAARCGEENTIAIALAGHFVTIHSILSSPGPSAIIDEFLLFFCGRHTPTATPIGSSDIISGFKNGFIIYSTLTTIGIVFG